MTPTLDTNQNITIPGVSPLEQLELSSAAGHIPGSNGSTSQSRQSISSLISTDSTSSAGSLLAKLRLDDDEWEARYDDEDENISITRRLSSQLANNDGDPHTVSIPANKFRSLRPLMNSLKRKKFQNSAANSAKAMGNTVNCVRNETPVLVTASDIQSIHLEEFPEENILSSSDAVSTVESTDTIETSSILSSIRTIDSRGSFSSHHSHGTHSPYRPARPTSISPSIGSTVGSSSIVSGSLSDSSTLTTPIVPVSANATPVVKLPPTDNLEGLRSFSVRPPFQHIHSFSNPVDVAAMSTPPSDNFPHSPLAKTFHHKFYHATAPNPVTLFPALSPIPSPHVPRARSFSSGELSNQSSQKSLLPRTSRSDPTAQSESSSSSSKSTSSSRSSNNGSSSSNSQHTASSPFHAYRQLSRAPPSPLRLSSQRSMPVVAQQQTHSEHPSVHSIPPQRFAYSPSRSMEAFHKPSTSIDSSIASLESSHQRPSVPPPPSPLLQRKHHIHKPGKPRLADSSLTPESRVSMAIALRKSGQSKEAAYQLHVAADQGNVEAMFLYGLSLRYGYGVAKDERSSFLWVCKSGGIVPDRVYHFTVNPKIILRDLDRSNSQLQPDEPRSSIFFEIGQAYLHGWGCRIDIKQGLEFLELSGSLGYCDAMCEAGKLWTNKNQNGGKRDLLRSASWFRLAERCGVELMGSEWIHKKKYD
ncbi:DEKNAAC104833 [Brettanomyces naardenensis]|uniref:DEKNAAC104833 n=1 Tax=Brettanomyces naardenensis TaxID=13370 RepID=A0A448YS68_BRENA|nr:DEKNAAC104833 [Brettanomyces naardenensis]